MSQRPWGFEAETVGQVTWNLLTDPYTALVARWNWKAAVLSAVFRAPIFLLTSIGHGWRRASLAMIVEAVFRAGTTGFFAAGTQAFRNAKPRLAAFLIMATAFPLLALALDALLHITMRTPNLTRRLLASLILSAVTSIFDWYIMRRGTMLVGEESQSFLSDLVALPQLVMGFLLAPSAWAWKSTRQWLAGFEAE